MVQYSGHISRQALINFCRAQIPDIEKKNRLLVEGIEYAESEAAKGNGSKAHTIAGFENGLMENYGRIWAFRLVCEWAKENMTEDPPFDESDYDPVTLKEKAQGYAS